MTTVTNAQLLDNSQIHQLADQSACGQVSSRTGQLVDDATNSKQHYVLLINFFIIINIINFTEYIESAELT